MEGPQGPWLLQLWQRAYHAFPKYYISSTNYDYSFSLVCALVLATFRVAMAYPVLLWFGWPKGDDITYEASGNLTSIFHAINLCPALCLLLRSEPYNPSSRMDSHPRWWQETANALLSFTTGYMIYDTIVSYIILRWEPGVGVILSSSDWLFLGHHVVVLFYLASARIVGAGHISACICMLTGEITNPFMNSHLLGEVCLEQDFCNGPFARAYFAGNELVFAVLYFLFRAVIGPAFFLHLSYKVLLTTKGRTNIPVTLGLVWVVMVWGVVVGSLPWVERCVTILQTHAGIDDKEL